MDKRYCVDCNKLLSRYNSNSKCYTCLGMTSLDKSDEPLHPDGCGFGFKGETKGVMVAMFDYYGGYHV